MKIDSPRAAAVDLWLEPLDAVNANDVRDYEALLDSGEQAKAKRFRRELDRRRYVVSHGKLRLILATYLPRPPAAIDLAAQTHGKPYIVDDETHGIKFNLAHSGDQLLVGVSQVQDVGVDIEVWNDAVDYEAVLSLCFADAERCFWRALPAAEKREFFFRSWARKESFIKAVGLGLGLDVAQVVTATSGPSRFLSLPAGYGGPEGWSLLDLELASGLSGALTVPGRFQPTLTYKRL
ncbi:4'-phosphopantetheinyl transferase superfamily protein [Methylomicrobium lacus]|uniref:4'-phosphopantetheinyl transferase family protein n=1 Tax=Methylomicrobium lacus TaxID=136992 RepID=UPI0035A8FE00